MALPGGMVCLIMAFISRTPTRSCLALLGAVILCTVTSFATGEEQVRDAFEDATLAGWKVREGTWKVADGRVNAGSGFSVLLRNDVDFKDGSVEAEVAYEHDAPFAASGILFRMSEDSTGYAACLREVEKGTHPEHGPWERPVMQLFRIDRDGWKLLQESKVMGCRTGLLRHLKVECHGEDIRVYYEDMKVPVLKEIDVHHVKAGRVGVFKDVQGSGTFDNVVISTGGPVPAPLLRFDWSLVRGAIYVRSNAVNAVQMWQDYWGHTELLDRELSLASAYGFNMIQVYLHWIVWGHDRDEYLKRIDDFLTRASKHGLKVNLIFWDDCGHVEPSLTFAPPVAGRHNSQMMPNPSHTIRDSAELMTAHRERFGEYVRGIASRFKDDPRIAFWQLYNEAMGAKERYRVSETDANINRLLEWTREWVKSTGTQIPVTATWGGFYGAKYSDFPSFHSYSSGSRPLPNAGGGPEHLCTETLNRPDAPMSACLRDLAGQKNGFVVWELMIGRDNCRFPWGHPDGDAEPAVPFHGVLYPDGHPWDVAEVQALMGDAAFTSMERRVFQAEYFKGRFAESKKKSITPWIDFDLGDETGTGSPDASAAIGKDNFSIRWTGEFTAPESGSYTFAADCDGVLELTIGGTKVLAKSEHGRREVEGAIELKRGQSYPLRVEYWHDKGEAGNHLRWSGPSFARQRFVPIRE